MEEGSSRDEHSMQSDGAEHDARASPSESNDAPRHLTRAATKASQPAKKLRPKKKGAISRAAVIESPSPPSTTDVATKPAWFVRALEMLRSTDGGTYWTRLLDVWSMFEAQEKYFEAKALPATGRPAAISEWMKQHRSPTWRPRLTKTFRKDFKDWWLILQPKWRVTGGEVISGYDGDFTSLKKSGANGLLIVIVGLFYWRLTIAIESEEEDEWLGIVEDCITIIEIFCHQ